MAIDGQFEFSVLRRLSKLEYSLVGALVFILLLVVAAVTVGNWEYCPPWHIPEAVWYILYHHMMTDMGFECLTGDG